MDRGSYAFIVLIVATSTAELAQYLQQIRLVSFSWEGIVSTGGPLFGVLALGMVTAVWIRQMGARLRDAGVQKSAAIFLIIACLGCWVGSMVLGAKWQNRWIPYLAFLVTQTPLMIAKSKVSQTP